MVVAEEVLLLLAIDVIGLLVGPISVMELDEEDADKVLLVLLLVILVAALVTGLLASVATALTALVG